MPEISFERWVAMTGDDLPAYMASAPAVILRTWQGETWEVSVPAEAIDAAQPPSE